MLPDGWKLTTLGKVCEGDLQTGPFGSQLHAHEYQKEGVPVLMPKDIINCRADITNASKISEKRALDLHKHRLIAGDLLFSRRGDVARFALISEGTEGSLCGTGCLKARPSKNHSPNFLSYILQKNTVKTWLEQNAVGQTMPNMNTAILNELPLISASSREEEDKIAQILSTWDKAIEKLECLITAKKKRKKALMQQLLTGKKRFAGFEGEWKDFKLKSLANNQLENSFTDGDWIESPHIANAGVRIIQTGNIAVGSFKNKNKRYISGKSFSDLKCKEVHIGDVLICRLAEPAGRACLVPNIGEEKMITSVDVTILKTDKNKVNPYYLVQFLSLPHTLYIVESLSGGSTRSRVSRTNLGNIKVTFPSIEEQQKIAAVLSAADKEIEIHQTQLFTLKQQKKGLMQQLLTGKKRVKIDEPVQMVAVGT